VDWKETGKTMSRAVWIRLAVMVPVTGFLWAAAAMSEGSIPQVLRFALAGTVAGLGLAWIGWTFASRPFTRRAAWVSASTGLLILTPVIAMLIDDSIEAASSSSVVLALSAAAAAAMGGASWAVMSLAGDAFDEWRREKSSEFRLLALGEAQL
jgi:hypothetical protein